MKKLLVAYCLAFAFLTSAWAKEMPARYVGFNCNPLLAQVIPFNAINPISTNASILVRSYNNKANGFRAGYGISTGDNNGFMNMYLSLDSDRRRKLGGKWIYFQGFGASLKLVSNNLSRIAPQQVSEEYTLALGWHWGVEYKFNDVFSMSTEATFRFGINLDEGTAVLKIDPPINLMAHFNIYKIK